MEDSFEIGRKMMILIGRNMLFVLICLLSL